MDRIVNYVIAHQERSLLHMFLLEGYLYRHFSVNFESEDVITMSFLNKLNNFKTLRKLALY